MKSILKAFKKALGFCEFEGCHHLAVRTFYFKKGQRVMSKNLCDDCAWKAYDDPEELWDYEEDTERISHFITDYCNRHPHKGRRKL